MPGTASRLSLSERREEASSLFLKGLTVAEVARKLDVTWDTAKGYERWHEQRIAKQAADNPQLLSDVLRNTVAQMAELDQVRAAAWRQYHTTDSAQVRLQALNTVRQATNDKAKLFGLFGVKQEFYVNVQNVTAVQSLMIEFLQREMCDDDRVKLEAFLATPEVQRFMGQAASLPVLELGTGDHEEVEATAV
jgi:multidrug efflux pump subunit AcrA (membrane-fusion protein)